MPALVQVKKLGKRFGDVHALEDVSFEIAAGEWIAIMGPERLGQKLRSLIFWADSTGPLLEMHDRWMDLT